MTGTETDKFCLRWNEYESNLSSAIQEVREEKCLYDVTVSCDGGGQFPAHRLVLAACSQVMREILCTSSQPSAGTQPHQLVYLRGVNSQDLQFILSFMYRGEVSLAEDKLTSFLAIAKDLEVKGLTQEPDQDRRKDQSGSKPRSRRNSSSISGNSGSRKKEKESDDEVQEIPAVKAEPYHYQPEYEEVGGGQLVAPENLDLMYQDQEDYSVGAGAGGGHISFDGGQAQGNL